MKAQSSSSLVPLVREGSSPLTLPNIGSRVARQTPSIARNRASGVRTSFALSRTRTIGHSRAALVFRKPILRINWVRWVICLRPDAGRPAVDP
jgi:hypothetical protein